MNDTVHIAESQTAAPVACWSCGGPVSPDALFCGTCRIDLLEDGLYLVSAGRTGFFLPQVARETGWTKEQLLEPPPPLGTDPIDREG